MNLRSLIPVGRERSVARRGSVEPFGSLQREIERLFEDFARGWPSFGAVSSELTPSMDVTETEKEIEITAELPGLEEKDVQVDFADNVLEYAAAAYCDAAQRIPQYARFLEKYPHFGAAASLRVAV